MRVFVLQTYTHFWPWYLSSNIPAGLSSYNAIYWFTNPRAGRVAISWDVPLFTVSRLKPCKTFMNGVSQHRRVDIFVHLLHMCLYYLCVFVKQTRRFVQKRETICFTSVTYFCLPTAWTNLDSNPSISVLATKSLSPGVCNWIRMLPCNDEDMGAGCATTALKSGDSILTDLQNRT